jgi:hypothetical protein
MNLERRLHFGRSLGSSPSHNHSSHPLSDKKPKLRTVWDAQKKITKPPKETVAI